MRSKRQIIALTMSTMLLLTSSTQQKVEMGEIISQEIDVVLPQPTNEEPLTVVLPSKEITREDVVTSNPSSQTYSRGGSGIKREYTVIVTYYTNSIEDCGKTDGIGANNKKMKYGYVAMPKQFPFGTKIALEGMGVFENQDRGSAIKMIDSNTIKVDMFIPNATKQQLLEMGKDKVKGYILQ